MIRACASCFCPALLPPNYAFAFCCFLNFAHRNFCAFAIFRRASAGIVYFFGCPFGAASLPANSRITAMDLSNLSSSVCFCARSPCSAFSVPAKSDNNCSEA